MRFWVGLVVVASMAATGCGGDSGGGDDGSSGNAAKVNQAKEAEASADQVHAILKRKLQLHAYAGVDDAYTVPPGQPDVHLGDPGNECSIEDITVDQDEVELVKDDPHTLVSPDGNTAVQVSYFQGTDTSVCLQAAQDALGW